MRAAEQKTYVAQLLDDEEPTEPMITVCCAAAWVTIIENDRKPAARVRRFMANLPLSSYRPLTPTELARLLLPLTRLCLASSQFSARSIRRSLDSLLQAS